MQNPTERGTKSALYFSKRPQGGVCSCNYEYISVKVGTLFENAVRTKTCSLIRHMF